MPMRPVLLRSPLVLVANASRLQSQLEALAGREGFPQSPYDIESDLNDLNAEGGVPITLSEPLPGKADWSVLVHTRRYLVRLFVTGKYRDAYSIASVAPLRLRDHQRLAQGYLLTRPRNWLVVELGPGNSAGHELRLGRARRRVGRTGCQPGHGRQANRVAGRVPPHARRGSRRDRAHHHRERERRQLRVPRGQADSGHPVRRDAAV